MSLQPSKGPSQDDQGAQGAQDAASTNAHAEAARRTFERMTSAPVAGLVIRLGIPTMISMLITALYNTASTWYVSFLGTSAVGAMGVVFALQMIIQALGIMFGQGCASQASRLLGARNYARANTLASSALAAVLIAGSVFGLLVWILMDSLLSLMGATPTILPYAQDYSRAVLVAAPLMAASFTLNNILRSEGLALFGMVGLACGGILNVAVAPVFIFVLDLGIAGAGWATMLCQSVSFFILLSFFLRGKGTIALSIASISRSWEVYSSILKNGMPSLTRNILGAVAASVLNLMAGNFGDAGVAGMSIVGRVMMITSAALIGIGQGYQPVLGYNWGAGRYERVSKAFDTTMLLSTSAMTLLAIVGFVFAEEVIAFFKTNDPQVIAVAVLALKLQCLVMPIIPVNIMGDMTYQVLGRTAVATLLASTRQGLFFLPCILILPTLFGLTGLQSAQPVAELCSAVICGFFAMRFRHEVREKIRHKAQSSDAADA